MKPTKLLRTALVLVGLGGVILTSVSKAALIPRGYGMVYDDVQNLTWLQDANFANTIGYATGGLIDWNTADTWVTTLRVGGYSDWRLPSFSRNGFLTMWQTELGNTNDPFHPSPVKAGPFINIQYSISSACAYWTDGVNGDFAYAFLTWQNFWINQYNVGVPHYVWPVRTGDVVVPTPPTLRIVPTAKNSIVVSWPTNSTGWSLQPSWG